jgi:hypothetical protein
MNCLNCQKELPADYAAARCPFCGHALAVSGNDSVRQSLPPVKTHWLVFFSVMLAPVLLTILSVRFGAKNGGASTGFALIGGGAAGIVCGAMLGRQVGTTRPLRIILGAVFAGIMMVVCIGMSCFGCLASGFQLRLN